MQFLVLGPLQLTDGDDKTAVSAPRLQQLIALLLMARGDALPLTALAGELWPDGPPSTADTTIRTYVHELRKLLPGDTDRLSTGGSGYRLTVRREDVDAFVFEGLAESARTLMRGGEEPDRLHHAADLLRQALALWRGHAFAGVPTGPQLDLHLAALNAKWLRAAQLRIHLDLLLGSHRDLIGELKGLVCEFPLDDRFLAQLMVALHRCGRRGEALRAYRQHQRILHAELGAAPTPRLRRLCGRILSEECSAPVDALLC
ncbi:BTAD domain-containing putative transcriptional regulator [Streptomyces sp. NPDC015127]|uniref:AfsR/SARP family transcriptional regulator n=1 Tax=Streptomyces sp. NPDC015127 TaxID=3364939 RepID=UPI003701F6FA